mmetsp:Transcript_4841/g.8622  ORF Transcript_4841/g.8622 Transcript_4841/m.8622 type:complete len:208 (+) Transcript_4841:555-1178(+)
MCLCMLEVISRRVCLRCSLSSAEYVAELRMHVVKCEHEQVHASVGAAPRLQEATLSDVLDAAAARGQVLRRQELAVVLPGLYAGELGCGDAAAGSSRGFKKSERAVPIRQAKNPKQVTDRQREGSAERLEEALQEDRGVWGERRGSVAERGEAVRRRGGVRGQAVWSCRGRGTRFVYFRTTSCATQADSWPATLATWRYARASLGRR